MGKLTRTLLQLCVWWWCLGPLGRRRRGTQWEQFQAKLAGIIPTSRWASKDGLERVQVFLSKPDQHSSLTASTGDPRQLIFLPGPEPRILCWSRGRLPGLWNTSNIHPYGHMSPGYYADPEGDCQVWKTPAKCHKMVLSQNVIKGYYADPEGDCQVWKTPLTS